MANIFSNLLDRDNPAKKLQAEIDNTHFRKQSLVSPLQNEIAAAQQKINNEIFQIGTEVYDGHVSGEDVGEKLPARFEAIKSLKDLIAGKQSKIAEIAGRYDEEIALLQSRLNMGNAPPAPMDAFAAPATGAGSFCEKCGSPYTPGEDSFCEGCGQKLS